MWIFPRLTTAAKRYTYICFTSSLKKKKKATHLFAYTYRCGTAFTSHAGMKPKYVSRFITRHDLWFSVNINCCCIANGFCTGHAAMFCTGHAAMFCTGHAAMFCTGHAVMFCTGHAVMFCTGHAVIFCTRHALMFCTGYAVMFYWAKNEIKKYSNGFVLQNVVSFSQ